MKKIIVSILVLIVLSFVGFKYLYHKHRNIATEKPAFSVSVKTLLNDFLTDETKANAKYLDKSITIKGKVTNVDLVNKTIVIDDKVFALLTNATNIKVNIQVSVQGRLIGYDSLLEEIKLDQVQIK